MAGSKQPDGNSSPGRVIQGHLDDWEELAIDYLDGTLDAATQAAVAAHLDACPSCAARLGVQKTVSNLVRHVALEDAPPTLEDQVIGEILFPPTPRRAVVATSEPTVWSRLWRGKFKPWIPATVAVVAFFAIMISVGVLRSGGVGSMAEVTTTAAAATTVAARGEESVAMASDSTAAPGSTEAALDGTVMNAATPTDDTTAVGGAGPTTTAVPAVAATPPQDKSAMIAELQAASAPVYFVFQAMDAASSTDADETSSALAEQVTLLTGLQPLQQSLAIGRTTFAAYVPKKDAAALVELLQSIGSSLRLTLSLSTEPIAVPDAARIGDYGSTLSENKALFPELSANRTPQPAVNKYSFTTSTLPSDAAEDPADRPTPGDAGTHVLVVIYLGG